MCRHGPILLLAVVAAITSASPLGPAPGASAVSSLTLTCPFEMKIVKQWKPETIIASDLVMYGIALNFNESNPFGTYWVGIECRSTTAVSDRKGNTMHDDEHRL